MAISAKKKEKIETDRRRSEVAKRSLDGKGYFMDGSVEQNVIRYIKTGEVKWLDLLPDYRGYKN